MARLAVLLRGVNVGRAKRLPMAAFRDLLTGLGLDDVSTYLASGQAVVTDPAGTAPATLARRIEAALADEVGLSTRVLVLTGAYLAKVAADCPYPDPESAPTHHHAFFLYEKVTAAQFAAVEAAPHAPEECALGDGVIYLYVPNGIGRATLPDAIGKKITVPMTARNWNTVVKLRDLTSA